ncbi:hypothetical protein A2982_00635 [candidate division WWE3 bacterium RIFCSPLOWO2_01_FULL_39_13]|uniref:Uncharacterized protein n=1 Tax=candidate division WWE3 bacterium RIFCSPLOWO2_01_FULL_39_13 TaxID=1802624 RepID=A0A1F4V3M3_UNCKA|nr:MAG: hypothetical protein A2982_00635 [candidate division WWE3 bacterium RIFCSPLOWO2_01_FULL_39_13]
MELVADKQDLKTYLEQVYDRELSEAEYIEYKNRLIKFFSLLMEVDQQQKKKSHECNANRNTNSAN